MRLCYIHYLCSGDTALYHVQQFVNAVRSLGQDIRVHAVNRACVPNGASRGLAVRNWMKARFSRYLHEPKEITWNLPYLLAQLRILHRERPDVLVVRSNNLTVAPALARAVNKTPLVLEVNAPAMESENYFGEYAHIPRAGLLAERINLWWADKITAVSRGLRDYLLRTHGVPPSKVVVNPNGADCEGFMASANAGTVRRRYRLGRKVIVGFVGTLHAWRGPSFLKAIIKSLPEHEFTFLLVGDGPGWQQLRKWSAEAKEHARTVVTGRVAHDRLAPYIAAMDIAIVPDSNFYSCPLKLLEYMAAARAIVAPRYPPIEDLIVHGEHGMLFPPCDLGAALCAIKTMAADPVLRKRLGENARKRAVENFTWEDNAARLLSIIRPLAQAAVVT